MSDDDDTVHFVEDLEDRENASSLAATVTTMACSEYPEKCFF